MHHTTDPVTRFNEILNNARTDNSLVPHSHFQEKFADSDSGKELYFENGQIVNGDIAKGGPAEAAGLKEGDVVVAVNKNFNQNLMTYKAAIQNAGERIKVIIQREGQLQELEFKVQSILH